MTMSYMMGIDVGTSGTRAVIVRPDGHVVGAATGDHEPMRMEKPGWAEQEPENWWQATIIAVRAALAEAGLQGSDIAAIGMSGQMHGVVLLDKDCAVLRPSLIWCDQRSQAQCDWITARVGGRAADSARLKSGAHRLERAEAALDSRQRTSDLRARGALPASQGLCALAPDGGVRHRSLGRFGDTALRCDTPALVSGDAHRPRNRTKSLPARL